MVELRDFEDDARRLLNVATHRALHLLLSDNPLQGRPVKGYPGLLELDFAGLSIVYVLSKSVTKVYLLCIVDATNPLPPPASDEGRLLRKSLDAMTKAGLFLGAKELLKQLWELIKNGFS